MKVVASILSASAVAIAASSTICSSFAPPPPSATSRRPPSVGDSRSPSLHSAMTARGASSSGKSSKGKPFEIPNIYDGLPWNAEREERRRVRRLAIANASLFRELGLPEDATYEDVDSRTRHLIDMTADLPKNEGIKRRIKIEIARDKIYQIRLNERISGVRSEQDDAARVSKLEEAGVDGL